MSSIVRKICALAAMPLAMLIALVIRALSPLILIRLGSLRSSRIGHFALDTEVYLCRRDLGVDLPKTIDFFYCDGFISNYQLKKMWGRNLRISWFVKEIERCNKLLPVYEKHRAVLIPDSGKDIFGNKTGRTSSQHHRDNYGLLAYAPAHLHFSTEEEKKGRKELRKIGLPDNASFVCIYGRDQLYLKTKFPEKDWSYHDHRDSNINNYITAANELTKRGYYVIRMGQIAQKELEINNPMIIDYAVKFRTDFLDIYLAAKCRFFLGVAGGLVGVPMIFRVPVTYADVLPVENISCWSPNEISIFKRLWLRKENRFLTLSEIFNSNIGRFLNKKQYEDMGIEIIDNTPLEIAALAIEMDERLKGAWRISEEDKELQRRFWSFFEASDPRNAKAEAFRSRIGTEFLSQNRELLYDNNSVLENSKLR